eukprot:TRINITY_DN1327_c0_g1_i2.p1 TRINITY_DN1327_c0_g1~~TRINITY_DN1327_c0_g1_i2.p1  ORF type:complete len:362 (+),score=72.03 TRINITY_DN1327_c0_g1_i2:81-1166(+)
MISLIVSVAVPFLAVSQGESPPCHDKQCQLDEDQFAMLQASKAHRQDMTDQLASSDGKPWCAKEGQDVFDDYTFASIPVTCCDHQAAQNCDGKMLCPLGGKHYGKAVCPGKEPAQKPTCASEGRDVYEENTYSAPNPVACCDGQAATNVHGKMLCPSKLCAHPGQDVYDDYTFKGHTPVACCSGQSAVSEHGKMVCPRTTSTTPTAPVCAHAGQDVYDDYTFKGRTPVACCDGQAPANQHGKMVCPAKPCANPGQDVYDDYTFKGHTPVHCCDGQKAANQNGKMLCPGGASPKPWQPTDMTEAWDKQIWCKGGASPTHFDISKSCTKYTCDSQHYISCCNNEQVKQKQGECWDHGCRYHCA